MFHKFIKAFFSSSSTSSAVPDVLPDITRSTLKDKTSLFESCLSIDSYVDVKTIPTNHCSNSGFSQSLPNSDSFVILMNSSTTNHPGDNIPPLDHSVALSSLFKTTTTGHSSDLHSTLHGVSSSSKNLSSADSSINLNTSTTVYPDTTGKSSVLNAATSLSENSSAYDSFIVMEKPTMDNPGVSNSASNGCPYNIPSLGISAKVGSIVASTNYTDTVCSILHDVSCYIKKLRFYLTTPQDFNPYFDPYLHSDSDTGIQKKTLNLVNVPSKSLKSLIREIFVYTFAVAYHYICSSDDFDDDIKVISEMTSLEKKTAQVSDLVCFNFDYTEKKGGRPDVLQNALKCAKYKAEEAKKQYQRHPPILYNHDFLNERWNMIDKSNMKNTIDWNVVDTYRVKDMPNAPFRKMELLDLIKLNKKN